MTHARVEAFTDAVIAIIMTIMILEFKTPESPQWTAILADAPYLFAYLISFLFIYPASQENSVIHCREELAGRASLFLILLNYYFLRSWSSSLDFRTSVCYSSDIKEVTIHET